MDVDMNAQEETWLLTEKFNGVKTPEFFSDLERLKNGEPLAYLIGHIPFLGAVIHLDSRPLIPRVETEYWVEKAIEEIHSRKKPNVLDLCAGSGCIGVAVLKHIPNAHVHFAEMDARHHTTIKKNIVLNTSAHADIYGGNLFSNIPSETTYDFILSNPPYIDPQRSRRIEESVHDYEPHEALFGGVGGMDLIRDILSEAPKHLVHGGILYLEHEPEQSATIRSLWHGPSETFKDQYGVERYTRLVYEE